MIRLNNFFAQIEYNFKLLESLTGSAATYIVGNGSSVQSNNLRNHGTHTLTVAQDAIKP